MIFGMIECAKLLQNGDEKYRSEYYTFADPLFHPSLMEKKSLRLCQHLPIRSPSGKPIVSFKCPVVLTHTINKGSGGK